MPRVKQVIHSSEHPSSCAMGNLYRYVEPITLYLLKQMGKTHGYELAKGIQEHALTDSVVEAGALYRTLRRLEENNFVVSTWDTTSAGPAKRVYELTEDGEKHLQEWVCVLERLIRQMDGFVEDARNLLSIKDATG